MTFIKNRPLNNVQTKSKWSFGENKKIGKTFSFETLEERQMLAISVAEFEEICLANPQLELSYETGQCNVIEIAADDISESALREAIARAIATEQDDLIVVRTTASQNRITLSGSKLTISAAKGSLTIVSLGDEKLTIDADQKSSVLGIYESTVILSGLVITGGDLVSSNPSFSNSGSGIFNTGFMTLVNCEVSKNNSGEGHGGGIFSSGTATIKNSQILNNVALSGGGGIYASGVLILENSVIAGNFSCLGTGISYRKYDEGVLEITNCTIAGNTGDGGAIYANIDQENSSGYDIRIQNTILSANFSQSFGAVLCFDGDEPLQGNILLENVLIGENYVDPVNDMGVDDTYLLRDERIHWGNHFWGYAPQFVVPPLFDDHGTLLNADEMDLRLLETSPALGLGAYAFQEIPTQKESFPEGNPPMADQRGVVFSQINRSSSPETVQEDWISPFQYDPSMYDRFFERDKNWDWSLWFLEWGNLPQETSLPLGCASEFSAGVVSALLMMENADILDPGDSKAASDTEKDSQESLWINAETRTPDEAKPSENASPEYQKHSRSGEGKSDETPQPESRHAVKVNLKSAG